MKKEDAVYTFTHGHNCAQSVLMTFAEEAGVAERDAKLLALCFGAGYGRAGKTCGALSGGIMSIGPLFFDKDRATDSRNEVYALTRRLVSGFEARFGSILCADILGCDLTTPEGQKAFGEGGMMETKCIPCVEAVVEMIEGFQSEK